MMTLKLMQKITSFSIALQLIFNVCLNFSALFLKAFTFDNSAFLFSLNFFNYKTFIIKMKKKKKKVWACLIYMNENVRTRISQKDMRFLTYSDLNSWIILWTCFIEIYNLGIFVFNWVDNHFPYTTFQKKFQTFIT